MILQFSSFDKPISFSDSDLLYVSTDLSVYYHNDIEVNGQQKWSWWGHYTLCLFGQEPFDVKRHLGHTNPQEDFPRSDNLKEFSQEHEKILEALKKK